VALARRQYKIDREILRHCAFVAKWGPVAPDLACRGVCSPHVIRILWTRGITVMTRIAPTSLLVSSFVSLCMLSAVSTAAEPGTPPASALADQGPSGWRFGKGKLQMTVERSKVDLERHQIEVQVNRPVTHLEIKVYAENKELLAHETVKPKSDNASEPIQIRWSQQGDTPVARIELFGQDANENWARGNIDIDRWSVNVPHQEINFETDKATIRRSEAPKLEDSMKRIRAAVEAYRGGGKVQLFVAGHTDTQGSASYNLDLSRRRAQAIAAWFVKNGLTIPVAFDGFGESALLVPTADEVDEPRNRRVDYILSVEPPSLKKSGRTGAWKYLNKGN
jgi:outer membrane protein OmpA-like peptidoglycan-associated protein